MSQSHKKLAKPLVFFVSTGRCGTQWLASNLARFYQDETVVTHEPLGPYYLPSTFFRRFDQTLDTAKSAIPSLEEHLQKIEEVVASGKSYIEVGWPIYGILPALIKHYGEENIKLIHLYRHPFSCSLSFYNGAWYDLDAVERKSTGVAEVFVKYKEVHELDPINHATFYAKDYYTRWSSMNLFEKCVFLWLEVNRFSFEIQDRFPNVKMFRVKFEDLIEKPKEDTMKALFQFLDLPYKKEMLTATDTRVDTWTWTFSVNKDANQHQPAQKETKKSTSKEEIEAFKKDLLKHPLAIQLGQQLGYTIEANDDMGTNREKKSTEPLFISSSGSKLYKGDVVGAYEMSSTVSRSLPYFRTCLLVESVLTLFVLSQALAAVQFDAAKLLDNRPVAIGLGVQVGFLVSTFFSNKGLKDLSKARKYAWALIGYFGFGGYILKQFFGSVAAAASSGAIASLDPIPAAFGLTVFTHYSIGLWMLYKVLRFRFAGNSLSPAKKSQ